MSEVDLNPTVDGYRGSIGRLVFKRYKGRTIVSKKPVVTAEPSPAQLAQRQQFKEAAAFGKSAKADPELRAFYEPVAREKGFTVYTVALTDFLSKPAMFPPDLSKYQGQIGDTIAVKVEHDLALAGVDVNILSSAGASIERGKAVENGTGTGKWIYTATSAVAPGSELLIEVVGVDYAGNEVKTTETHRVSGGS